MVVDDEKPIVYLIKVLLELEGLDVMEAYSGREAYDMLTDPDAAAKLPDVIVLDAIMPEMDGYTLQSRLRETERLKKIPIIMLTGKDNRTGDLFSLSENVFSFLEKPFEPKELVRITKAALASLKRPQAKG
jgi:CheY-like chemotaxis protein